jgi:hypothetical protein
MEGLHLQSISGKSGIQVLEVDLDEDYISLKSESGEKRRPLAELRRVVDKMKLNLPIFVDCVLGGSGSSRNQPETLLVNLPDVEWLKIDNRKHIVWLGRDTHELGTIRTADAFTAKTAQQALADFESGYLAAPISMVVFSSHISRTSQFLSTLLQGATTEPIGRSGTYRIASSRLAAILLPGRGKDDEYPRVLSCVSVPNAEEAVNRIKAVYPDSISSVVSTKPKILIVRLNNGTELALAEN